MNQGWTYTDRLRSTADGKSVLDYYTEKYLHSGREQWQAKIEQGQILLDGQAVTQQTTLKAGQTLTYHRLPWQEPTVPLDFEVLYEDEDLWAIAKPSGLPVLPGGDCLAHTLLHQLRRRYPQETPVPVHRLGRATSGLMLIAKSQAAREGLSAQFRERSLSKIYRALIGPTDLPDHFTCDYPIGKVPYAPMGYLYAHAPNGLAAYSECHILRRDLDSTLVEVSISTGRAHQIRIHLAAAGYPLLGDPLYAAGGLPTADGTAIPSDGGYWLHSHRVRFAHPRTGKTLSITAEPPAVLQ